MSSQESNLNKSTETAPAPLAKGELKITPENYTQAIEGKNTEFLVSNIAKAENGAIPKELISEIINTPGGAKALASSDEAERAAYLKQIELSATLHGTKKVILMVHMDCGGYGGSKAFDNDHQKEWDHHVAELEKAAAFVRNTFSEIKYIESWIGDFDGLHKIFDKIS